ncbi:inorganic pyrophosphatase [Sodiomyces alkalinus F11]|uniref:inorganic diphosphatase n=1 Tax=Sodiomyces alkalinus (strain CBS 110278 / VKM F-3762 / F11) TaxID=1314773 RepID=A0A3N2PWP8_SODAK|nr:inorganic pyrophosphatase [Sodiomyces alkalinus F11]ROT38941.1 inorganic pyrophosphatase [Sodiomyces alkalinus F11]
MIFFPCLFSFLQEWRVWLEKDGHPISFWHDVPLYPDAANKRIVNFVVEIPRWEDGKIEIRRQEPLNPIFHDDRNSLPRFVESVFPLKSYPFLYGSIPQTWESPNFNHDFTNAPGDNDPIDLFDVGQDVGYIGQVKQVKILGALAPNDGGETDWKVLGIDVNDPIAPLVDDFEDLELYRPGLLKAYRDWFTYYKVARGGDLIPIVGETYQNSSYAASVVETGHAYWLDLVKGAVDTNTINYNQTSRPDIRESYVSRCEATLRLGLPAASDEKPAAPKLERFQQWFYLDSTLKLIEENVVV